MTFLSKYFLILCLIKLVNWIKPCELFILFRYLKSGQRKGSQRSFTMLDCKSLVIHVLLLAYLVWTVFQNDNMISKQVMSGNNVKKTWKGKMSLCALFLMNGNHVIPMSLSCEDMIYRLDILWNSLLARCSFHMLVNACQMMLIYKVN